MSYSFIIDPVSTCTPSNKLKSAKKAFEDSVTTSTHDKIDSLNELSEKDDSLTIYNKKGWDFF